jgi:hypothetical protein
MILLKQLSNSKVVVKIYIQEDGKYKVYMIDEMSYIRGEEPSAEIFDTYNRAETYAKDCLIWE